MATQEQIQQAKIEYSTWSLEDFHKTPQKNLYKIARAFDIRTFTTPSGVVYSSKVTRTNRTYLEKVLWEILEEYRAAQVTRSKQITHSKEFGTYRSFALTINKKYVVKQNRQTAPTPINGVATHYAEKIMLTN